MNPKKFSIVFHLNFKEHFPLTAVLVSLACPMSLAVADPIFDRIEPFLGARYGLGYDLAAQRPALGGRACVLVKPEKVSSENDGTVRTDKKYVKKSADLVKEMNLSAHAQVKSLSGTYDGSSSLEIANKSEAHQFSETWLFYNERREDTRLLLTEEVLLADETLALLKGDAAARDEFRARCGNAFVVGLQEGSYYYGTAFKSHASSTSTNTLNVGAKMQFTGTAKFTADFKLALREVRSEEKLEERITSSYSDKNLTAPRNREELEAQWQAFKPQTGTSKAIAVVISPYSVVQNAPRSGVLAQSKEDQKIDLLLEALWDLKTLKDEARYVLRQENKFALGLFTSGKRSVRLADVQRQLARWTLEFDELLVSTKNCINKYEDSCTALANRYGNSPKIAEQRLLPKKYKSYCYGKFDVQQIEDAASAEMRFKGVGPLRGDGEMGGGPVIVKSVLTITPDGRRLKSSVKTTLTESKSDFTTFEVIVDSVAFDLMPKPGEENIFEECEFAEKPINRPAVAGSTTYGTLEKRSGKDPRGMLLFDGGSGLLNGISCEVDFSGPETNKIACKAPQIWGFQVLLVNRLDKEADQWRPQ